MNDPLDDPIGLEASLASRVPADLLVPCDVAGLLKAAEVLRSHATVLEGAGDSLARVEVAGWRGRAADGFTDAVTPEPARWRTAADSFLAGAVALEGFVSCIGSARSTAGDAIALWQRYLATAAAAVAMAGAPAQPALSGSLEIGARVGQQQAAAATGSSAAGLTADADELRRRAITTLAAARRQAQSAGDVTTGGLTRAAEAAPQARRFWEATIRPANTVAIGHASLDALGMVPALGIVPDGVNATWYAASGDGRNAAVSAAGMVPILGAAMVGGRLIRNATRPMEKLTDKVANPLPTFLYIAGTRTKVNLTPRPQDSKGLSSYDNLEARIFSTSRKAQIIETARLKTLQVHGPDGPDGHYSIRPRTQAELEEWMATREGPVTHRLAHEMIESVISDVDLRRRSS